MLIAGVEGFEPPVTVLETVGLPLTDTPKKISKINTATHLLCKFQQQPLNYIILQVYKYPNQQNS